MSRMKARAGVTRLPVIDLPTCEYDCLQIIQISWKTFCCSMLTRLNMSKTTATATPTFTTSAVSSWIWKSLLLLYIDQIPLKTLMTLMTTAGLKSCQTKSNYWGGFTDAIHIPVSSSNSVSTDGQNRRKSMLRKYPREALLDRVHRHPLRQPRPARSLSLLDPPAVKQAHSPPRRQIRT